LSFPPRPPCSCHKAYPNGFPSLIGLSSIFPLTSVCCIPATWVASPFGDALWCCIALRCSFLLWKCIIEAFHLAPQVFDYAGDVLLVLNHARRDKQDQLGAVVFQGLIAEKTAQYRNARD